MKPSRSLLLRFGWLALPIATGGVVLLGACGDDDPVAAGRDAGPDTRKPPSELPPPSIDPDEKVEAGATDAKALYPTAWDRNDNPRDASIDAQDRFCNGAAGGAGGAPGFFCWDFGAADGVTGWNEVFADGGSHELSMGGGPAARQQSLRSTVFRNTGEGPKWVALRYLVPVSNVNAGFTLSFSFHAALAETYAIIGGVQIGSSVHGLALHPSGCLGQPCIGESLHGPPPAPDVANRRPFDPNAWYRAQIRYVPTVVDAKVTWGCTITVGGTVVATRTADAFPATETLPTTLNVFVGAFDTKAAGNTQVEIDDVVLE